MQYYITIDPAKCTGFAMWEGNKLVANAVIKPCGNKGNYWLGPEKVKNKFNAFNQVIKTLVDLPQSKGVFIECGAGRFHTATVAQALIRGYIEAICESYGLQWKEVKVNEWRRVIKEDQNISWPAGRELKKALAVKLVKELYGIDVCDDVADAVLLGRAVQRMGMAS